MLSRQTTKHKTSLNLDIHKALTFVYYLKYCPQWLWLEAIDLQLFLSINPYLYEDIHYKALVITLMLMLRKIHLVVFYPNKWTQIEIMLVRS